MGKGVGGHGTAIPRSDEWLTPREIIGALGEFDLDPCAPVHRPWPMAKRHYTIVDNGLIQPWPQEWRVWLNPPYGDTMAPFLIKMADHRNGILLTFARFDRIDFHEVVLPHADSMFLFKGRLNFYTVAGTRAKDNGGAPSVLFAYGENNSQAIEDAGFKGKHIALNSAPVIVVGISPSWKAIISIAMNRLNGEAVLNRVYEMVEIIAPDKIHKNKHYKEKVRQVLQQHFTRKTRGHYTIPLQNEN